MIFSVLAQLLGLLLELVRLLLGTDRSKDIVILLLRQQLIVDPGIQIVGGGRAKVVC